MLHSLAHITDALEHFWEETVMKRFVGPVLVLVYLAAIGIIELNRQSLLPAPLSDWLPLTHFGAIEIAFTLLLFTEVVSLIFGLTRSFSRSIGIQMEILSLILLRDTFKKFSEFSEPLVWVEVSEKLDIITLEALGALAIFIILQFYYRTLRESVISDDAQEVESFIAYKKLIALGLIITFIAVGVLDLYRLATRGNTYPFFETFFTILVFTDVLMVLLSLRYSADYGVTFRNFSYALVTLFVRLALIAPPPINAGVGVGATLFGLMIAFWYNRFGAPETKHEAKHNTTSQVMPQVQSAD